MIGRICRGLVVAGAWGLLRTAHAAPPAPAPPTATSPAGYWLSVDLVGAPAARSAAIGSLSQRIDTGTPIDAEPPGAFVGRTLDLGTALSWVARHAFATHVSDGHVSNGQPTALATGAAPVPGGALVTEHDVIVRAFIITGATEGDGVRAIVWPTDQREGLPTALAHWVAAALTVPAAPMFAAPAPSLPPAIERHAMAQRAGGLFVLGWLDRCDRALDRCLRWAQVIARDGDRFTAGYLPAYLVAPQDAWVRGAGSLPRAQLTVSGTAGGRAEFLLLARDRLGEIHTQRLTAPLVDGRFPATTLNIVGDVAHVTIGSQPKIDIALDATMDLRPRH